MDKGLMRVFTAISGWQTPEDFGHDNDGYVTFEPDPKTQRKSAFFWKADMSHEHLNAMWLSDQTFVRRALVALAMLLPFSAQADPARDEFVQATVVAYIRERAVQVPITQHVTNAVEGWETYQRLIKEKQ